MNKNPILIAPSILSADFADMAAEVRSLEQSGADLLHCDVMDGEFVPNLTFGPKMIADIRKRTKLPLDAHLMIIKPERYAQRFIDAGADYVTIHIETAENPRKTLEAIKSAGAKAGIVINPNTAVSAAEHCFDLCAMVLLMSVQPGFGGQKFIPHVMDKIKELHALRAKKKLNFLIEIDGGITLENVAEVKKAGAEVIVAGSTIFAAPDRSVVIARLRK